MSKELRFHSIEQLRNHYLPALVVKEKHDKLMRDPKKAGEHIAENTLARLRGQPGCASCAEKAKPKNASVIPRICV